MNRKTKSNAGNGKVLDSNRNTTISHLLHPTTQADDKKFYSFTPYRWEVNNPIAFLDPIGIVIKEGNYKEGENRRGMFNFYGIFLKVK